MEPAHSASLWGLLRTHVDGSARFLEDFRTPCAPRPRAGPPPEPGITEEL